MYFSQHLFIPAVVLAAMCSIAHAAKDVKGEVKIVDNLSLKNRLCEARPQAANALMRYGLGDRIYGLGDRNSSRPKRISKNAYAPPY